jgi:hypothetical protein
MMLAVQRPALAICEHRCLVAHRCRGTVVTMSDVHPHQNLRARESIED